MINTMWTKYRNGGSYIKYTINVLYINCLGDTSYFVKCVSGVCVAFCVAYTSVLCCMFAILMLCLNLFVLYHDLLFVSYCIALYCIVLYCIGVYCSVVL